MQPAVNPSRVSHALTLIVAHSVVLSGFVFARMAERTMPGVIPTS